MALIEVTNLKYRYPHTKELALDGLDFQVERGSFIGIAGANKAGKSTLCQAFAGLVPTMFKGAYGGRVMVDGLEAGSAPVSALCRKVGLIFQNPFNQLSGGKDTVFEEIAFGLQNLGVEREEILKRVEENLRLLDIDRYRDRNPFDLSGGQIQRVAIAGILAMEPEIIVLDEPTSQLDPQGSEEVFRVVDQLVKKGITVIMAEQKLEKLAAYCDKLLLLHKGKQVDFDTPERIFSRADLAELGMEPPVYTKISQAVSVFREEEGRKLYPVTMEGAAELKALFPPGLKGKAGAVGRTGDGSKPWQVFCMKELSFHYLKGLPVLQGLSLELDARPTAIIGQNGAGKTTLVKLLKGLLKPCSGSILLEGEEISGRTVAQLAGKVGYVFQNPDDQIFKNRVLAEVMVGPLHLGMSREKAMERAKEALSMVGLLEASDENPYDLELAERKLIAVASVVAMDTRVLILDEPTIAQDAGGRAIIGGIIRRLSAAGKFVLAILHDMDFAAEYFERVIVMAHGRVLADGEKETVFYEKEALTEARLEQPHTAALCDALGYEGPFMTVEDVCHSVERLRSGQKKGTAVSADD